MRTLVCKKNKRGRCYKRKHNKCFGKVLTKMVLNELNWIGILSAVSAEAVLVVNGYSKLKRIDGGQK